jgi:hypothetical protein
MVRTPRKRVQRRFSNAIKKKSGPIARYIFGSKKRDQRASAIGGEVAATMALSSLI